MLSTIEFARNPDAMFAHIEACWDRARGARKMPRRQDISPSAIGRALPFVSLIDVVDGEPMDFRYRLIGQHLVSNTGQNLTGCRSSELPSSTPNGRPLFKSYLECVRMGARVRDENTITNMNGTRRRMQWQLLPLGETDDKPDALFGAAFFHE